MILYKEWECEEIMITQLSTELFDKLNAHKEIALIYFFMYISNVNNMVFLERKRNKFCEFFRKI